VRFLFAIRDASDGVRECVKAELPVTARFIIPVKPLTLVNVIVEFPLEPCIKSNEALEVLIANPEIVMLRLTDRTRVLFVPVTVTLYALGAADCDAEIVTEA